MLFVSPRKRCALNLPVLLPATMLLVTAGAIVGFTAEPAAGSAFGVLLGLGGFLFFIRELRWLRVEGDALTSRNLFGKGSVSLMHAALGIEVFYSARGGPSYHIYALAEGERIELAVKWTKSSAERARQRLVDALLPDPASNPQALPARQLVASREAGATAQQQAAQAQVDAYYASGKHKRLFFGVFVAVAVYVVGVVSYLLVTQ